MLSKQILDKASAGINLKQWMHFVCLEVPDEWPEEDNSEAILLAKIRPYLIKLLDATHKAEVDTGVTLPLDNVSLEVYGVEGKIEVDASQLVFPIDAGNRTTMHELASSASGAASASVRWYLSTHPQPSDALYIELSRQEFRQHVYQSVLGKWSEVLGRYLRTKALIEKAPASILAQFYLNQLAEAEEVPVF